MLTLAANNSKQILPKSLFPPFPPQDIVDGWREERGTLGEEGKGGASSEEGGIKWESLK